MKILWITNIIFPYPAQQLKLNPTPYGGWMISLADELIKREEIKLGIAVEYSQKYLQLLSTNDIAYFLIPKKLLSKRKNKVNWRLVCERFNPDLIHIHGSEFSFGLNCMLANRDRKYIISVQ